MSLNYLPYSFNKSLIVLNLYLFSDNYFILLPTCDSQLELITPLNHVISPKSYT